MELVAVIQIALQPAWYELESYERERLRRDLFQHLGADNSVRFRWFDADAWTGSGA